MHRSIVLLLLAALAALAACNDSPRPSLTPSPSASVAGSPTSTPAEEPSATSSSGTASGEPPALQLEPVLDGLVDPVDIAWRPDDPDTLFVVEQVGRVRIVRDGQLVERPFLDISGLVRAGGESGLLGLAFLPSGEAGTFFVYYTARADGNQVVASYDTDPDDRDVAAPSTEQVWLRMDDQFGNHNGGATVFGPDGYLYIGTGDGGGGGDPLNSGRSLDTLLAKVLRIDVNVEQPPDVQPRYVIPEDNPFVEDPDARQEIWLTGLRNPWRIRFDRANGDLWIGDVGQSSFEEIDVARAGVGGLDYGWNAMEGTSCFRDTGDCASPDLTLPVTQYDHDLGCSVTGGAVYRGAGLPALEGWYVFSDYCSGRFWAIDAAKDTTETPAVVAETDLSVSAIAEDAAGELYATDLSGGRLLRIGLAGS